ncbi:MAG: hypothetical protein AB7S38_40320 [Vulcanimicrobiota bacterium]
MIPRYSSDVSGLVSSLEKTYHDPSVTVAEAQKLARKAHQEGELARQAIDSSEQGYKLRLEIVDPLLAREREIQALKSRLNQGGPTRATDNFCLGKRLRAKKADYDRLRASLVWEDLPRKLKFQLADYVAARRREVRFGDAETVRKQAVAALELSRAV